MSDPAARKLTYAWTWEGITVAAARTADRAGLSTSELEHIRDALAGGRRPKVVFTAAAGQIAGQQGQVVELIDPTVNDEWVVVRFGHDELPFSPADLAIPTRGTAPRRATKTAPPAATLPPGPPLAPGLGGAPAPARPVNSVPTPREESTVTRPASTAKTTSAKSTAAKAPGAKATAAEIKTAEVKAADTRAAEIKAADAKPVAAAPAAAAAEAAPAEPQAAAKPAKAPARKAGRAKAPATLTVTLTYSDGEWMVGAQQGSKALAKPYVIRAAEALKMVGMLDVPGVHDAVEEIVSSARAEAEAAADKLRAELAEIEARLAELREAG
jgi:hypothetical protein